MEFARRHFATWVVLLTGLVAPIDSVAAPPVPTTEMQLELAAIGYFGPDGAFDPGARIGMEHRPWSQIGYGVGFSALRSGRDTPFGDLVATRLAADALVTVRESYGSITSTGGVGARAGWALYRGPEELSDVGDLFFAQAFVRGRGEWDFHRRGFLLFQAEFAWAFVPAEARAGAVVVDRIAGLDVNLMIGAGWRF